MAGKGRVPLTRTPTVHSLPIPGLPRCSCPSTWEIFNNSFRGKAAGKFTGCRSDQTKFTWQYPRLKGRRHSQDGGGSRQGVDIQEKKGKKMWRMKCVQKVDEPKRLMKGKRKLVGMRFELFIAVMFTSNDEQFNIFLLVYLALYVAFLPSSLHVDCHTSSW